MLIGGGPRRASERIRAQQRSEQVDRDRQRDDAKQDIFDVHVMCFLQCGPVAQLEPRAGEHQRDQRRKRADSGDSGEQVWHGGSSAGAMSCATGGRRAGVIGIALDQVEQRSDGERLEQRGHRRKLRGAAVRDR